VVAVIIAFSKRQLIYGRYRASAFEAAIRIPGGENGTCAAPQVRHQRPNVRQDVAFPPRPDITLKSAYQPGRIGLI
jgi:hypothetical protein